ncbi:MAG: AAA family ATPase [Gemmataceae bacterium]
MNLTIPIYVEPGQISPGSKVKEFLVRPVFFEHPQRQHEKLERALHLLAGDLRTLLQQLGEVRGEALVRWTFDPAVETTRLEVPIELRKRVVRPRLLFVTFEALGCRLAMAPRLPEVWFELRRGEELAERAIEVLTAHFRQREREEEDLDDLDKIGMPSTAWVTPLELEVQLSRPKPKPQRAFAFLGESEAMSGAQELRRVGRCLDELYPDDLDRVVQSDVDELTRLLRGKDRRPVLLVGPSLVGKTTLVHEYVWRTVHERRERRHRSHNNVWLLSPQRLISGMMYVGQWENRLLAILAEAKKRDHVLYFDDLLGLYLAGQTCQSTLSVAHVLKPFVERREVRLLGETTPEGLRVLRERDRGFVDLFQIVPVREPTEEQTLRMLIAVQRQLEGQHRTTFDLDVLPTVLDLTRRYLRHLAFPGKGALALRRLAVKHREHRIFRHTALREFHEQSGLALSLLDGQRKLERAVLVEELASGVIGQPAALEAVADVICIAKARLNDPERPLGSLLFLGPTGVGKTQCARAVAKYLFGDAEKLLRFDMNEFSEVGAAARLAGTFDQPEGLLTASVRRQPFAVVLLDEIEKAYPEVFDLLLAVLGEGRLTDALGRTVDFTNTLILMTSNLGVREAQQSLGFRAEAHHGEAYALAAQRFFRPEFFNRLDRIVPFNRLGRGEVQQIARLVLAELLQREGLVRRKCVLRVDPAALAQIVDAGFDPVLGARALKRAVERQLAQPVARLLAQGLPETITVLSVYAAGATLALEAAGLHEVEPMPRSALAASVEGVVRGAAAVLRRIDEQMAPLRPRGEITAESIAGEHVFYYQMQEQLRGVRQQQRALADALAEARPNRPPVFPVLTTRGSSKMWRYHWNYTHSPVLREMAAASDLQLFVEEVAQRAERPESGSASLWALAHDLALVQALTDASDRPGGDAVLIYLQPTSATLQLPLETLSAALANLSQVRHGIWKHLEVQAVELPPEVPGLARVVRGLAVARLLAGERGTHLFCAASGHVELVQVHLWPLADGADPVAEVVGRVQERQRWIDGGRDGADPLALEPVVRIYNVGGHYLDLRTQLTAEGSPELVTLIQQALPIPAEVLETSEA